MLFLFTEICYMGRYTARGRAARSGGPRREGLPVSRETRSREGSELGLEVPNMSVCSSVSSVFLFVAIAVNKGGAMVLGVVIGCDEVIV